MATGGESEPVTAKGRQAAGDRSPRVQILTHPKTEEVLGILGIAVAIFLLAGLLSYDPLDPSFFNSGGGPEHQVRNYGGRWGAELAGDLLEVLGVGALTLPFFLVFLSWRRVTAKTTHLLIVKLVGFLLLLLSLGLLAQLLAREGLSIGPASERPGGFVGKELQRIFSPLVGRVGLPLLGLTALSLAVACLTSRPLVGFSSGWGGVFFPVAAPGRGRERARSLLDMPSSVDLGISKEELEANAGVLERKLLDFGVEGKVAEVQPGPVITRYEIEPAPGIKINRIVALADDLALALRALTVRVVAPIPGKAAVGVEIPNRHRAVVHLREVLSSKAFDGSAAHLPLALGKDIAGEPFVAELAQMPHLLIAGATGSGKSVCINALILSLLYKATPESVRLLLIDPKRVELSI